MADRSPNFRAADTIKELEGKIANFNAPEYLVGHTFDEVVKGDFYLIHRWPANYFDAILDVGGNVGVFSYMARRLHPKAVVIAIEPCHEARAAFEDNLDGLGVPVLAYALGEEGAFLHMKPVRDLACTRFVDQDESGPHGYGVECMNLGRLSKLVNSRSKMFVKIDCEGGERALIHSESAIEVIRHAVQTSMEIHWGTSFGVAFPNECLDETFWSQWTNEHFEATHYIQIQRLSDHHGRVVLTKKADYDSLARLPC